MRMHSTLPLILVLLPALGLAETYRVDNVSGNDGNNGVSAPFRTLAAGLKCLKPGDTLLLTKTDQPYRESLPVRVGGTPQAQVIIDGGGATLSGADAAPTEGWTQAGGVWSVPQPTAVKRLYGPEVRYEQGKSADALAPEQWFWAQGTLYFRPQEGKKPADYGLQMSVREMGVLFFGAGQVIVRNLTVTHCWDDGFNIHNGSGPLWFENIRAVWNGDQGFSAHENCECYVRGADFSNNRDGITDVGAARTHYQNVICRGSTRWGICFIGGVHSLTDVQVSGGGQNINLARSDLREFPKLECYPPRATLCTLRNVSVQAAPTEIGLAVGPGATAVVEHCVLRGGQTCVQVADGGHAYVVNSVMAGGQTAEVSVAGAYDADYNLYWPGRLNFHGTTYAPEQFDQYRAATQNDGKSRVQEPQFIAGTLISSLTGPAAGAAYDAFGYGGSDIGLELRGPRPAETLPPVLTYDFETHNPWSRVYPEPTKNAAGAAVTGTAELSDEQAHSGRRSCKLSVQLPAGPPAFYNIKLFSDKLPYPRPVKAWRFWMYGDNSGRSFVMRVRDASGEGFYGAPRKIDWSGWKQLSWDLTGEPPSNIVAGDGNKQQDCPPLELVLELTGEAGKPLTVYLDDLEVELQK